MAANNDPNCEWSWLPEKGGNVDPNPFKSLLHSRKFWLAVLALVQTILFQFVPDFPDSVWVSINGVLVVLIATIAWEDNNRPS